MVGGGEERNVRKSLGEGGLSQKHSSDFFRFSADIWVGRKLQRTTSALQFHFNARVKQSWRLERPSHSQITAVLRRQPPTTLNSSFRKLPREIHWQFLLDIRLRSTYSTGRRYFTLFCVRTTTTEATTLLSSFEALLKKEDKIKVCYFTTSKHRTSLEGDPSMKFSGRRSY